MSPYTTNISGKSLWDRQRPYVIAEVSGNHAKNRRRAEALVIAAGMAGADAVKFQTFTADEIAAKRVRIPRGVDTATDAWLDRLGVKTLRDLFTMGGLPREWHKDLKECATQAGLAFLSTPFSVDAAKFLVEEIGVPALKIASGDLTFEPLLEYANTLNIPIILSTGGATLQEVHRAVDLLPHTYESGNLALLHCVSVYPCPDEFANLNAIRTLGAQFLRCPIGFSDHTLSIETVPALAVATGATILEKHITLDDVGVDAGHSLDPRQFRRMVQQVRQVHAVLGTGKKEPCAAEMHDRLWARRSPRDWKRPTDAARRGQWE